MSKLNFILYKITFQDNDIYYGGNLEKSLWNQMPKKPIKKLEYNLFSVIPILEGYEAYNHLIERVNIGGKEYISRVLLMGKIDGKVDQWILNLNDKSITQKTTVFGQEYDGKKSTGWKEGLRTNNS